MSARRRGAGRLADAGDRDRGAGAELRLRRDRCWGRCRMSRSNASRRWRRRMVLVAADPADAATQAARERLAMAGCSDVTLLAGARPGGRGLTAAPVSACGEPAAQPAPLHDIDHNSGCCLMARLAAAAMAVHTPPRACRPGSAASSCRTSDSESGQNRPLYFASPMPRSKVCKPRSQQVPHQMNQQLLARAFGAVLAVNDRAEHGREPAAGGQTPPMVATMTPSTDSV